jgi:hypothetical protein
MSAEDPDAKGKKPSSRAAERDRRLAEALRANLRRRKAAAAPEDAPPESRSPLPPVWEDPEQ